MADIFKTINEIVQKRQKAAFCIVTESKGSTPRKEGSKMVVYEDGKVVGSIGGGELEYYVVQKAQEIIKSGKAENFNFGLEKDFQMGCGGKVSVFVEPIKLSEHLIIFGAGHISRELAKYAKDFNFDITVVDERDGIFETWNEDNFTLINKIHDDAYAELNFDKETYICIMTHAHKYDKVIAGYCGAQESAFLGVIASKTKAASIRKRLVNEEVLTQEQADKIEMPLGVPMKCEFPNEIAISVLGRLIDIRNLKH